MAEITILTSLHPHATVEQAVAAPTPAELAALRDINDRTARAHGVAA